MRLPEIGHLPSLADQITDPAEGLGQTSTTGTTMTVKIPEIDIVLWAQAVTALAGKELPYCWEDWSPRDGELGDPKVDEVIALLPDGAELVFGSENMTKCRVLATCDGAAVQVVAFLDRVNVVTAAGDPVTARQLGREVLDEVHRPPGDKPGDVPLLVWSSTDDQFEVNKVVLSAPRWSEIKGNYPEATRRDLDWLMGRTEGDQTGGGGRLILFHGPPGTGKSFAIQALLNEWEQWCRPEYVVDPKTALLDYKNLHQLLSPARTQDRKGTPGWRIVVAEDADQFIRANHRSPDNGALDKLLNATDGILAHGARTLFLLTTNIELATINPALARPGRCLAVVSFGRFAPAEARKWLGGSAPGGGPTTLAELYEAKTGVIRTRRRSQVSCGQYL